MYQSEIVENIFYTIETVDQTKYKLTVSVWKRPNPNRFTFNKIKASPIEIESKGDYDRNVDLAIIEAHKIGKKMMDQLVNSLVDVREKAQAISKIDKKLRNEGKQYSFVADIQDKMA